MSDDEPREPIWGVDAPATVPCRNPACSNELYGFWGEPCSQECYIAVTTSPNTRQEEP